GVICPKGGFGRACSDDSVAAAQLRPFWDEVQKLGVMVYLHGFFEEWRNIANLAERYPGVPIVHTIPTWNFPREGIGRTPREGKIRIRQDIRDLLGLPNVYFEITPIAYGAAFEYPYTEAIQSFLPYYEELGGSKFMWGSDMPNLERCCLYLQGIDYLRRHWNFISGPDKALILGGNAARVFNLVCEPEPRNTMPPKESAVPRGPAWKW